jgi:hypothetical protein
MCVCVRVCVRVVRRGVQQRVDALKRIRLERLPKVLCIHLKRFRWAANASHYSTTKTKISTPVRFPTRGLDLAPYILSPQTDAHAQAQAHASAPAAGATAAASPARSVSRSTATLTSPSSSTSAMGGGAAAVPSPIPTPTPTPSPGPPPVGCAAAPPPLYDLVSVIRHHGLDSNSGHYTAYALNAEHAHALTMGTGMGMGMGMGMEHALDGQTPADAQAQAQAQWFQFDDATVTPVSEDVVANAEAYILFYQQRGLN